MAKVQEVLSQPVTDRFQDSLSGAKVKIYQDMFRQIAPSGRLTQPQLENGLHRSGITHAHFTYAFDAMDGIFPCLKSTMICF